MCKWTRHSKINITEALTSSLISLVISGTSTDVSRFAGHFEHVFETTTAGITIQAPQVSEMIIFMSLLNRF